MRISVEINLRADVDPIAIQQWLEWGRKLDAGLPVTTTYAAGEVSKTETMFTQHPVAFVEERSQPEIGDEPDEGEHPGSAEVPPGVAPPGVTPAAGKPRGRPRKNAATAAQQAAALAAQTDPPQAAPPVASPQAIGGFAVPPGIPAPAAPVAPPQQPVHAEPVAAMPKSEPAPTGANGVANGIMVFEDFRTALFEVQTEAQNAGKQQATPFNVMRAVGQWPDGTPKAWNTMSAEKVPPEERMKVIEQCQMALMR